jgi:hypothetical protein
MATAIGCLSGMAGGFVGGFSGAFLQGASLGQSLAAGFMGGVAGGLTGAIMAGAIYGIGQLPIPFLHGPCIATTPSSYAVQQNLTVTASRNWAYRTLGSLLPKVGQIIHGLPNGVLAAGVSGGAVGGSMASLLSLPTNINPVQLQQVSYRTPLASAVYESSYLSFNGNNLIWNDLYSDGTSRFNAMWDAVSGPYGNGHLENGSYTVDNLRIRTEAKFKRNNVGYTVDLTPNFVTNRTDLRIHPCRGNGTEGCIGLFDSASDLNIFYDKLNWYFINVKSTMNLVVHGY